MPDDQLPDFNSFPDENTAVPDSSILVVGNAIGLLTSQNGDNLFQISLDMFVGPTPQDGAVRVDTDAKGAREIAKHLNHLADYAEIGVEAPHESA